LSRPTAGLVTWPSLVGEYRYGGCHLRPPRLVTQAAAPGR